MEFDSDDKWIAAITSQLILRGKIFGLDPIQAIQLNSFVWESKRAKF
jgi:hypothetical protein